MGSCGIRSIISFMSDCIHCTRYPYTLILTETLSSYFLIRSSFLRCRFTLIYMQLMRLLHHILMTLGISLFSHALFDYVNILFTYKFTYYFCCSGAIISFPPRLVCCMISEIARISFLFFTFC
jgi:uncharacterized membrane protein